MRLACYAVIVLAAVGCGGAPRGGASVSPPASEAPHPKPTVAPVEATKAEQLHAPIQLPPTLAHVALEGDGGSCDSPLRIVHARDAAEAHSAWQAWLSARYGQFEKVEQALVRGDEGKKLEELTLKLSNGSLVHPCLELLGLHGTGQRQR